MSSHGFYCCVDGCKANSLENKSFFRCPKNPVSGSVKMLIPYKPNRCQECKDNLGFVGEHKFAKLTPEEAYTRRICSAHFNDESFSSSGKRLLKTAVPIKLLPKLDGPFKIQTPLLKLEASTHTDTKQEFVSDKMATVEQCETQTSGLSNTLTIYDTFKTSHEEEKDSDEESFHLPLLDCDDDPESTKDNSTDSNKEVHNGETEDEILNKFESTGTPDIDPKMEDSILDEIDNILEKKTDEDTIGKAINDDGINTKKELSDSISKTSENTDHIIETTPDDQDSESNKNIVDKNENNENGALETEEIANKNDDIDKTDKPCENEDESDVTKNTEIEEVSAGTVHSTNTANNTNESYKENTIAETEIGKDQKDNDLIQCSEEKDETNTDLKNTNNKTETEVMELDSRAENINEVGEGDMDDVFSKGDILFDDPSQSISVKSSGNNNKSQEDSATIKEKTVSDATVPIGIEDSSVNIQNSVEIDKCENSNDSNKSQNLECEDLLDISIIRDADEDNASAIEENANEVHTSEKSDNDNDDQDEISDKAENELDESEMDQDDTTLTNDKDDNMDFEDGGSNLCEQDNMVSENISDSESKSNAEMRVSENDSNDSNSKSDNNHVISDETERTEEENCELKDSSVTEDQETFNESETKSNNKRTLSETDVPDTPNKKIKLLDRSVSENNISNHKNNKINTLVSFEKFMQNKKLENKLTRSDLEQFCLQKICEAIMHKTDVGELHQTIKKQEQIIESLRKDLQQLTKQTRDLDIVNKKLMSELRVQNGTKKPLVPLKITRSVGLQVKLSTPSEAGNRRKGSMPSTPRTPNNSNNSVRPRNITPANSSVVRQVAMSPRKTTPPAPLLSQALQNRSVTPANTVTKRPSIRPKPAEPQKPPNSSVIDLTDEDDKASKGAVGTSLKMISKTVPLTQGKTINIIPAKTVPNKMLNTNQNKTVAVGQIKTNNIGAKVGTTARTVATLPQGVRLTPTQVKNGSITIPASVVTSSSGTTQFMYVVQPGPVVTSTAGGTQKAVLLNFQPTNGVLTSTLNGSAVSVLPSKTSNAVQLKTVPVPRKHPAPLPSPPPVTLNGSLKPLLPKPHLSIRKTDTGIILQWRMPYNLDIYEAIASYQLFAYQETNAPPSTEMWRKVGDVKALALPMACTLTQFADKNKYYFAVRSIDVHKRIGAFSDPEEISL